jgi:predicted nucleotidyltransferase component of viral defense system
MADLDDATAIEFFHLAFLQVLQGRLSQSGYILKGGTNLRYFFESARYSEDIDLDVTGIQPWKLEDTVDGLLEAPALKVLTRGGRLAVDSFSKPKQTETTQRWKVALRRSGHEALLRTRIEFSHRRIDERHILESVSARVVAPYALRAPSVRHYTAEAAVEQKVAALAERSETQARDVFDLELLLRPNAYLTSALPATLCELAAERALELPFAAFRDQVLPFLDPHVVELHASPATWEKIRSFVVESLLEGRR